MAQKCLILVTAGWGQRRFATAYRQCQERGQVQVVAFSGEAQQLLRRLQVPFAQVVDYAERPDEFDLARAAIRELNQYASRPVGGRPFGEWLEYQGLPLWNFISPNLFADVSILLKSAAILEKILDREEPDCVVGLDTQALPPWFCYLRGVSREGVVLDRLAGPLCQRRGIAWQPVAVAGGVRLRYHLSHLVGRMVIGLRAGVWIMAGATLIRRLMGGIADGVRWRWQGRDRWPKILFFSHKKYWRKDYNPIRNQVARTDTAIYPVVHQLLQQGRYQVRGIDGNYGFLGGLRELFGKLFCEGDLSWQAFDSWYPFFGFWKCRQGGRSCRGVLARGKELEEVFAYNGHELGKFFLPRLEFLFRDYLWKSAIWIEGGRNLIRREAPALVVLAYETGTLSRAIINACHESGVPTLGVQHGAFSESTDDYVRTPPTHLPQFVPDKTAVWGERFRRVMVEESAFREDEVVVTGNPRMDFLVRAQSLLEKEVVYQKYGLEAQKKIILAAPTETIGRTRHLAKDRFFEGVMAAKRALGQHQWVVKLKPGAESEDYYRALMKEYGETDLILTEDDLYALLVAADVVVTPPSSIAIEALIVGKPVIYVVFPDAEDYFPHLSAQEVVSPVHQVQDLPLMIEEILAADQAAVVSPEKLRELLEEENFQPDGHAASRVVEVMENLISPTT